MHAQAAGVTQAPVSPAPCAAQRRLCRQRSQQYDEHEQHEQQRMVRGQRTPARHVAAEHAPAALAEQPRARRVRVQARQDALAGRHLRDGHKQRGLAALCPIRGGALASPHGRRHLREERRVGARHRLRCLHHLRQQAGHPSTHHALQTPTTAAATTSQRVR